MPPKGKTTIQGDYIRELIKKFPDTPNLTLAKKAYKDEPKLFTSLDTVRSMIRTIRGAHGEKSRKSAADNPNFKPLGWQGKIPESLSTQTNVWHLPKAYKKVLLLSDIHIPFHEPESIAAALQYGKDQGIDAIYLNGDTLDFYQLSFHEKDPRKVNIATELQMGREFLKYLRDNFDCPIYWVSGNHEIRLQRYLQVKAPELLDITDFELKILLRFGEYGIQEVPYGSKVYFGKLMVEHGDKMRGSGGVNPARTLLLKFKRPTICGHFHRHSEATQRIYDGEVQKAWSLGCLCELEPSYFPLGLDWSHGAAVIEVNHDNGHFVVDNFQIIDGRVYK
jgi:predicted phosphodiesterase